MNRISIAVVVLAAYIFVAAASFTFGFVSGLPGAF